MTGDGTYTYQWDAESRLAQALNGAQVAISTNTYDAFGERVQDDGDGVYNPVSVDLAYGADGALLSRETGGDANTHYYVPFQGRILADYYGGTTPGTIFNHPDGLGSVATASDYTGKNFQERLYYPFGEFWTGAGSLGMHQEFASLYDYDAETDQYNTPNRHYNPMGRWMSPDPLGPWPLKIVGPQRWNMYAYTLNNPTSFTDPTGLDAIAVDFSTLAQGAGHWAIISVGSDGRAVYSDFSPQGGGKPLWFGEVHEQPLSTKVTPGGVPDPETFAALQKEVAIIEKVSPDTVSFAYFRTSDADTRALQVFQDASSRPGYAPLYSVGAIDCRGYATQGLQAAGISTASYKWNAFPNDIFELLELQSDAYYSSWQGEQLNTDVTSRVCPSGHLDSNGNFVCE